MKVRPIPKHLLIHTVEYEKYKGNDDAWSNPYEPAVTLEHVRVDLGTKFKRSSNGETITYKGILFFDLVNSEPLPPPNFVEGSKITLDGQTVMVGAVNPIYTNKLHHYELELV